MKTLTPLLLIFSLMLSGWSRPVAAGDDPFGPEVREALHEFLQEWNGGALRTAGGEAIRAPLPLADFYRGRDWHPAWSKDGRPTPTVRAMMAEIWHAHAEGLVPEHYHLPALERLLAEVVGKESDERLPVGMLTELDLLLTDAFLVLGSHYLSGRTDPSVVDPEWHVRHRQGDLSAVLADAILTGEIGGRLRSLLPTQPEYVGLRQALEHYRQLSAAGGWPIVPEGPILRLGDSGPRITALAWRLAVTGELLLPAGEQFDAKMEEAVRRFQFRHGLKTDGVVGRATLTALNVPASERVRQIEVNLERWRWLPTDLGKRFILVNIADFSLSLIDGGNSVVDMRVVVGRPHRRTPVFSDRITHLVLNPYWQIPEMIAVEDILPQVRRDRSYLGKMGLKIFQGWGADSREIDPATVDWTTFSTKKFPYRLRQEPGPMNALGRIKFMLPNEFDVYLHDTPARELFQKTERTFSSGCIRVERPLELAEYLLQGTPYGSRSVLETALKRDRNITLSLREPMPVHLLYWTSWVDRNGLLHFRHDVYRRDEALRIALDQPPHTSLDRVATPLDSPRWPGT